MGSIFVSVASYRDPDCKNTIEDLFNKADDADRVFVGLCQQNEPGIEDECGVLRDSKFQSQVRVMTMNRRDARGPTFARFLCSTLWRGERYYLQIDSHMRFVQGWDTKLISLLTKTQAISDKPVISTYPTDLKNLAAFESGDVAAVEHVPRIMSAKLEDNGMVRFVGALMMKRGEELTSSPFAAAGFMFTEAQPFLSEVPFDPYLDDVFSGEEVLLSARLYTHGFDVFAPNENVTFHKYIRDGEPKFWENERNDAEGTARAKYFLGMSYDKPKLSTKQLSRFGLGGARPVSNFWELVGLDPRPSIV